MSAERALVVSEPCRRPRKDVTSLPTASTTPANSFPSTVARGPVSPVKSRMKKGLAARQAQSARFTVVA